MNAQNGRTHVVKARVACLFFFLFQIYPACSTSEPVVEGRSVSDWISQLGDKNPQSRLSAVGALGQIGPAAIAAVPPLTDLIKDDEPSVRRAAVHSLTKIDPTWLLKLSVVAPANKIDPSLEGSLVSVTGALQTDGRLEDPCFLLPVPVVRLERKPEMYAWVEKKEPGSYRYVQEWTSTPQDHTTFQISAGHFNPPLTVEPSGWIVERASVGIYEFAPREAWSRVRSPLKLMSQLVRSGGDEFCDPVATRPRLEGNYLTIGPGTEKSPNVGLIRVSYNVIQSGMRVTLFGMQSGNSIVLYKLFEGDASVFQLLEGARDDAIDQAASIAMLP